MAEKQWNIEIAVYIITAGFLFVNIWAGLGIHCTTSIHRHTLHAGVLPAEMIGKQPSARTQQHQKQGE